MFGNYKVIAATPAGRKRYLEILLPYILRDRGLIDEYHLWVNTSNELDIAYIKHLESCFPDFIRLFWSQIPPNGSATVYQFYPNCINEKTIYIKIDDDICFIESSALNKLVEFRIQHPEYFLVYANIVNNVICSHIHQRFGIIPIEAGKCTYDPFSEVGWKNSKMAATLHKEFIKNWEDKSLTTYKFSQWILDQFERASINFVCWFGEEFAQFGGNVGSANDDDDEEWLAVTKPKKINKYNAICGTAVVSHFSYFTQRNYLETYTKYLSRYKHISCETAKQNNLFSEIEHIGLLSENTTSKLIDTKIEECINKIRTSSIEQLQDAEWLENSLLIQLGLNGENLDQFPKHLHPYCGYGLKNWQYPNQFSKYLVWLSQQEISSYLEIGCRHGGTFIITVEYLERFGNLDIAVGVDPFYSESMEKYSISKANVNYLKLDSSDLLLNDIYFDLVLVGSNYSEESITHDYNLVRKCAKLIAFNGIVNVDSPGVGNLWQKLKKQYSHNVEFIDQYPSLAHRNCNYLGIGLIDTRYYNYSAVFICPVANNTDRPFWSVMIPTYNCANYLVETLKSVLGQDPGAAEMQIEVIDDCSTKDDPEGVVKEIGQGRVSFFRKPHNGGAVANFNTCIERAKGKWIHILHADDTVLPGFYSHLRAGIEQDSTVGAAITRCIDIDKNSHWVKFSGLERETPGIFVDSLRKLALSNGIMTPSIVVKRSVYEQLGGFNLELIHCADWEMWRRIAVHYPIWYEPKPLACYRKHPGSDTAYLRSTGANIIDGFKSIDIAESYLTPSIGAEWSNLAREKNAIYGLETAMKMIYTGNIYAAVNQIRAVFISYESPKVFREFASLLASSEELLQLTANLFKGL